MRYLVAGGAGFIGSNITRKLLHDGHNVVVLDNFHTGSRNNVPDGADMIIESECENIPKQSTIGSLDGIFYANGASSSPMYKQDPSLVGKTINGFIHMLEIAHEEGCKLVYASSSSVYNGNPVPWHEDMEIKVTDLYAETRFEMERLARLYRDFYDVRSIGLRLFSVYGPGEKYKGEYANLITQFMWAALDGKPIVIYGDGSQRRDFTYIDDVVRAFFLAMYSPAPTGLYNVGTGVNYSLDEMLKVLGEIVGKPIKREYIPNPIKNYVADTLADTTLSKKKLGFVAEYSLEEGIRRLFSAGGV